MNTLQIELENLIKAKNIKLPGYHRNATDFRKNLIKQNPIFVERPVDEKIHTLKKIKEWFLHPEQIEGVNFGEELFNTQPWQRTKKYYNGALYDHPFYSGMILQNREQVIMNLIEKITKRKYIF
ncbi:MAG: hypothetical protein LBG52_08450 [Candidatus Peribacteria bacterium]|nr:hypothetical protein [Candidatus Peribacteria bacterium]